MLAAMTCVLMCQEATTAVVLRQISSSTQRITTPVSVSVYMLSVMFNSVHIEYLYVLYSVHIEYYSVLYVFSIVRCCMY